MSFNQIFDVAGSAMNAQTVRLNTISSNLANADSVSGNPNEVFKPLKPVFVAQYDHTQRTTLNHSQDSFDQFRGDRSIPSARVMVADVIQVDSLMDKRYEPSNPLANDKGFVYYSGINAVNEMADMMSASRSFELNVDVLGSAKSMQQSLIRVLEV
ncbi:flagellar basal body rod protein FlgC [Vibrio sp.]|nr:flagellar basal body rod protein FlgC [Vibrio sp.]